jgi:hypothetical protein
MITHFHTIVSILRDWSRRIGTGPRGWRVGFSHCPAVARICQHSQALCVVLYGLRLCFRHLMRLKFSDSTSVPLKVNAQAFPAFPGNCMRITVTSHVPATESAFYIVNTSRCLWRLSAPINHGHRATYVWWKNVLNSCRLCIFFAFNIIHSVHCACNHLHTPPYVQSVLCRNVSSTRRLLTWTHGMGTRFVWIRNFDIGRLCTRTVNSGMSVSLLPGVSQRGTSRNIRIVIFRV